MTENPFIPKSSRTSDTADADVRLADPGKPGGPSDYSDPSPVNAEHVMNMMRSNFPESALAWVMRARWTGPVNIPWERIDKDSIDTWAASHQPEAVSRFARDIKAGVGHTNPSVLIQDNDSPKAIIIDGHHRALAHHKLGQPVLAYLGNIDPKDRQAAEETHSKQVHSGVDPRNKVDALLEELDGLWFAREIGRPVTRKESFKVLSGLRDAGRDVFFLEKEAAQFGWTVTQLDSRALRTLLCG